MAIGPFDEMGGLQLRDLGTVRFKKCHSCGKVFGQLTTQGDERGCIMRRKPFRSA